MAKNERIDRLTAQRNYFRAKRPKKRELSFRQPHFMVKTTNNGVAQEISAPDLIAFVKRIATANGLKNKKINQRVGQIKNNPDPLAIKKIEKKILYLANKYKK